MRLDWLNALPPTDAARALLACCGSRAWARRVAAERPFASVTALLDAADRVWGRLAADDWLEAFSAHPQIGERTPLAGPSGQDPAHGWSAAEQAGATRASAIVLEQIAAANRVYRERFGYIFIVCATGRSAPEMLDTLRSRLENDPSTELRIAAEEQRKITELRLRKLMTEE